MEREFVVTNEQGIHARPATKLVQLANDFSADLDLLYKGSTVDLKSIMGVLSLGVTRGSLVVIRANGEDENEAIKQITKFFQELNN
ncbi:Phosphocarrier protein HPr [Candidatus Izimaplasma bacterium HR1]|jgi:phosphocarrier protein|uniref:HPr family phosphocarrier protein n=1 Tax=Candidatus Izimoplasma sp. HR1 TaxID=1541959 RepID=UPI0004F798BF|nr:Phosphocarrier protein HPr [Candidatus Izimaplasma bacterium HR1]